MAATNQRGGTTGPAKARWALIHRVPVYGTGRDNRGSRTGNGQVNTQTIRWKHLTQWVKVGSPKWNRIHAAASKSGVHITPTAFKMSAVRPTAVNIAPPKVNSEPAQVAGKGGKTVNPLTGKGPGATNPKGPGNKPPKGPPKGGGNFGIGNPNVNKTQSMNAATAMAFQQFGQQIADTKTQQAEGARQAAQNQADITNWYNQLAQQNNAGGAADAQATGAAGQQMQNTMQSLMASIGGGANPGSADIAVSGQDALANLLGQGITQQNFITNRGVADSAAQAGQKSAQAALDSQKSTGLASQLIDLLNQQHAAVITNRQQILAQNNAAHQANFGNQISRLDAILGARQAGGNAALQALQIKQAKNAAHPNGNNPSNPHLFVNMTNAQKIAAIGSLIGGVNSATGQPNTPKAIAIKRGQAMGWSVNQFGPLLNSYYT